MREPLRDKERILHILQSIELIQEHTAGVPFETFATNKMLYGGVVYYTMIIGEAAYKLSRAFIAKHPETPWQSIADMRHHLVHGSWLLSGKCKYCLASHSKRPCPIKSPNRETSCRDRLAAVGAAGVPSIKVLSSRVIFEFARSVFFESN